MRVKTAIEESMKRVIKRIYRMISNLICWEIKKALNKMKAAFAKITMLSRQPASIFVIVLCANL